MAVCTRFCQPYRALYRHEQINRQLTGLFILQPSVAEVPTERPPMDIFRAIFESSDVEEANDAEPDLPLIPPAPTQSNADPIKTLFEIDSSTRTLEKKEYSVVQESPSVIGPARPPPELLAAYASVSLDPSESSEAPERRKAKHKKLHKPEKVSVETATVLFSARDCLYRNTTIHKVAISATCGQTSRNTFVDR